MKVNAKKKENGHVASGAGSPRMQDAMGTWQSGSPQKPDEMSQDVLDFLKALDDYRNRYNKKFPSWSEVLGIVHSLGYRKVAKPG
ncbi:MAG: hypothetical protein HY286_20200 [Planctomycetes bacterium]|nr:hypothetical protein [Planctomycetota bacterium]